MLIIFPLQPPPPGRLLTEGMESRGDYPGGFLRSIHVGLPYSCVGEVAKERFELALRDGGNWFMNGELRS